MGYYMIGCLALFTIYLFFIYLYNKKSIGSETSYEQLITSLINFWIFLILNFGGFYLISFIVHNSPLEIVCILFANKHMSSVYIPAVM